MSNYNGRFVLGLDFIEDKAENIIINLQMLFPEITFFGSCQNIRKRGFLLDKKDNTLNYDPNLSFAKEHEIEIIDISWLGDIDGTNKERKTK